MSDFGEEQWVVKNTFIEFQDTSQPSQGMKKSNSESDLSTYSSAPSATLQELKDWQSSSPWSSKSGSQCSTPLTGGGLETSEECTGECPEGKPPTLEAEELYNRLLALGGTRTLSAEVIAAQDSKEIRKHVPLDKSGNLTSIGSIMHCKEEVSTHCRPCIFWSKRRCGKGHLCLHCHYKHPNIEGKRLRASKATRERRAKLLAKSRIDCDDDAGVGSSQGSVDTASSHSSSAVGSVDTGAVKKKPFKSGTIISL